MRKRTESEVEKGGEHFTAVKGAAQVLLAMAQLPDDQVQAIRQRVEQLASKGYRTLAVGRTQGQEPLNGIKVAVYSKQVGSDGLELSRETYSEPLYN